MQGKIIKYLLFTSLVLIADWESDVSNIRSKLTDISYHTADIEDELKFIQNGLRIGSYGDATPSSLSHTPVWFGQMLWGTDIERIPGTESLNAFQSKYPAGYKYQFGLRDAYKDDSQFILDYISNSMTNLNTDEHFDLDKWDRNVYQYADYPSSFLNARSKGDWINKANEAHVYGIGDTQSSYVTSSADQALQQVRYETEYIRSRIISTSISQNYSGVVFTMNFDWLRQFIKKVSNNAVDPESLTLSTWSISLIPEQGDWFYNIWVTWNSLRFIIDSVFIVACYGSLILFVFSKVSDILDS